MNTSVIYKQSSILKGLVLAAFFALQFSPAHAQLITTTAGNYSDGPGYSGDGGAATAAELYAPGFVALSGAGSTTLLISDQTNNVVRSVNSSGTITTVAGKNAFGPGYSGDGGQATSAELNAPAGIADNANGDIFIVDRFNYVVRKVNGSNGVITTFAGNNAFNQGYSGDGGQATSAELNVGTYSGIALDASGNVYISDAYNNVIRKVNTSGIISTVAGNYAKGAGYSGDGGAATSAELNIPAGIAIDNSNNLYIADQNNNIIRKVTSSGIISTVAGIYNGGIGGYSGDGGAATSAELNSPVGVAVDASGNIFIGDFANYVVREVNSGTGKISTVAGNYAYTHILGGGYSGDGGLATSAELSVPAGVAVANSKIYIADYNNNVIREVFECTLNITSANVLDHDTCNGDAKGKAVVNISGGTAPFTYSWSPGGQTKATATGLTAGTYTVTVMDHNGGCTQTATVTITQPTLLSITMASQTNVSCNGGTGSATANAATGGVGPYTYSWSPSGGTNLAASNLTAGSYNITATDNHGCTAIASVTITQPAFALGITITNGNITDPTCFGGKGDISPSSASGGTSPYTYNWTPSGGTNNTAFNLSVGTYTLTVTDNHGCTATASGTITQPAAMNITQSSVQNTDSTCNGMAVVNVISGGTGPYEYLWSPQSNSSDTLQLDNGNQVIDTLKGLCGGTYCCTITQSNGCSQQVCVTVTSTIVGAGINNISNASSIKIYPDPNNGYFTVTGMLHGQVIELYNYTGQKLSSVIAYNADIHFDIANKANGVYLVKILNKDGTTVTQKKIVKMQ